MGIRITLSDRIEWRGLSSEQREKLKKACTVKNPKYDAIAAFSPYGTARTRVPRFLYFFSQSGKVISTPRGVSVLDNLSRVETRDYRHSVPVEWPKHLRTPTPEQTRFMESVEKDRSYRKVTGTYLFIAPAGIGKSSAALLLCAKWKQRTLVIVDRELLMKSWIREIRDMYGIKCGVIQRDRFSIGEFVTVAMVQTLSRREEYLDRINGEFGAWVLDECDLVPAPTFSKIVSTCSARYLIGMTATEKRKDRMHRVMYLYFGRPLVRVKEERNSLTLSKRLVPVGRFREVNTTFKYDRSLEEILSHISIQRLKIEQARNKKRNDIIVSNVVESLEEGRHVLVACSLRAHAKLLYNRLLKLSPDSHPVLLLGGQNNSDEEGALLAGKSRVAVATQQLIQRGVNIPILDCVHIVGVVASETNTKQLVGRVRRACPGKTDCWIYDYVDIADPLLRSHFYRYRIPVYRQIGVKKYRNFYAG